MTTARNDIAWHLTRMIRGLAKELDGLSFNSPVSHVYNPLGYAESCYREYLKRYARLKPEVVLVGMNPGPWGMVQTGIPFGVVSLVRDWLGIERPVGQPEFVHPKRPVMGFSCAREEVSGLRLWGWARDVFGRPERFFERFFVANYCPLAFFREDGGNVTPDKISAGDRVSLFDICDRGLREMVMRLEPRWVIGVGNFAEQRARAALSEIDVRIGRVPHPSPASPAANRGWAKQMTEQLVHLGIEMPDHVTELRASEAVVPRRKPLTGSRRGATCSTTGLKRRRHG